MIARVVVSKNANQAKPFELKRYSKRGGGSSQRDVPETELSASTKSLKAFYFSSFFFLLLSILLYMRRLLLSGAIDPTHQDLDRFMMLKPFTHFCFFLIRTRVEEEQR